MLGCVKNAIQPNALLQFSTDTIKIDTVITQLGTNTHQLLVYNPYNKSIIIHDINMASGANSEFIFNVNGMGTGEKTDIELKPKDSLYIFIQAKLKKNNADTLVTHKDNLLFTIGNSVQEIKIISWGRDATFYKKQSIKSNTTWDAGKTVLIFDSVVVETGQTLTINEGALVLFKPGANLVVNGTLIVNGSIEKPVTFEGYRLENSYQQIPGQWGSIILGSTSRGNTITNAIITDGTSGFQFKHSTGQIDLSLENVTIKFMGYSGLSCYGAKVKAVNCVFANCNSYCLELTEGGDYQFIQTTISNFDNIGKIRNTSSVYLNNFKYNGSTKTPQDLTQAIFQNSIIAGNAPLNSSEFVDSSILGALNNVSIQSCFLKVPSRIKYMDDASIFSDKPVKLFIDDSKNFALDSFSVARRVGNPTIASQYPYDIKGRSRIADGVPDLGAYEYFKDTTKVKH